MPRVGGQKSFLLPLVVLRKCLVGLSTKQPKVQFYYCMHDTCSKHALEKHCASILWVFFSKNFFGAVFPNLVPSWLWSCGSEGGSILVSEWGGPSKLGRFHHFPSFSGGVRVNLKFSSCRSLLAAQAWIYLLGDRFRRGNITSCGFSKGKSGVGGCMVVHKKLWK